MSRKTAIITGAASGLGRELARAFADADLNVLLCDIDRVALEEITAELRTEGHSVELFVGDLRDRDYVGKVPDAAVRAFGGLDILVNNARTRVSPGQFVDTAKWWDDEIAVLLTAPVHLAIAAAPALAAGRSGSILNISSTNSFAISHQSIAYHAAKAGLEQATRKLAFDLAGQGIRVNALVLGLIDLPGREISRDQDFHRIIQANVPAKRACTPEEIAQMALYLCSAAASYLTGSLILMDGGLTLPDPFFASKRILDATKG